MVDEPEEDELELDEEEADIQVECDDLLSSDSDSDIEPDAIVYPKLKLYFRGDALRKA